jgi:tetratricopeptide (TPR) repeat protein
MPDEAPTTEPRGLPASRIWYGLLATLAVVLVLLFLADVPERIARWHWAAAYDRYLDGDVPAALAALEPAFGWDDGLPELYYQRGEWRMEQGEFEKALADFDRTLDLLPRSQATLSLRLQANDRAAQALRRLGRCEEMSQRQDALVKMIDRFAWEGERADEGRVYRSAALNGRAYAVALCGFDDPQVADAKLAAALQDIQDAIRERREVTSDPSDRPWDFAFLDTKGYVLFRLGIYAEAALRFELAVGQAEEWSSAQDRKEAASDRFVDRRPVEHDRRRRRQELAVLYQHRGLAYEQLGRLFDAEQDFARAKRLGYDPERGVE